MAGPVSLCLEWTPLFKEARKCRPGGPAVTGKPAQPGISLSASIFLFQLAPIAQHEKISRLGGIVLRASPVEQQWCSVLFLLNTYQFCFVLF